MKRFIVSTALALMGMLPAGAWASFICYVADGTTHYSSAPFDYEGDNVEQSTEARSFFDHVRGTYEVSDRLTDYCFSAAVSSTEIQDSMVDDELVFSSGTLTFVQTGFKPGGQ